MTEPAPPSLLTALPARRSVRSRRRRTPGRAAVAVFACPDATPSEVPEHERWIAICASLQHTLLAAATLGLDGSRLHSRKTTPPPLPSALGLALAEHLVGFLTLGSQAEPTPAKWSQWP